MKHLHTLLLSLILLSSISYAQPMNNWNVNVLLDATAPKHGMYKECHASTLIEVEPGKYQLAWFGGSYEGADDVRIWSSFYDQDSIWTAPVPIANSTTHKGEPQPCWNPVLFKTNGGKNYTVL